MQSPAEKPVARYGAVRAALCILLLLAVTRAAWAHIRLSRTDPARDSVISVMPEQLLLEFSGRVEQRYTRIALYSPDGTPVATGAVEFAAGSDRIITIRLPPLVEPGSYRVDWRTAGADGHVLEGSWSFALAADPAAPAADSPPAQDAPAPADEHAGHHDHGEPDAVVSGWEAVGRGLHFLALLLVTGAVAFRLALLPRLVVADATRVALRRRAWQALALAAALLGIAAVLRLYLQSAALHGAERAWSTPLLSIMLRDTAWGRAWMIQVFLFAILGAAIAWARPERDRFAARLALVATAGLCAIPAMSGHAAGVSGSGWLIVANDALHVAAGGAWLGTLALLLAFGLRTLSRAEGPPGALDAVHAFSPLALAAAAIIAGTGVVNTVVHLRAVSDLWTTQYGASLLWKIGLVAVVMAMGFINWRFVLPRARARADVRRLRLTAAVEVVFALLVIAATAVLTGQPRP